MGARDLPAGIGGLEGMSSDNAGMRATMVCGHCKRAVWTLHVGAGPGLCCECCHVHRLWQALAGNEYCDEKSLAEHGGGKWCEEPPWTLFETLYAERSQVTVDWLREHGREVRPCDCDEMGCVGWQMAHLADDWLGNPFNEEEQSWQAKKRAGRYLGASPTPVLSLPPARSLPADS